MCSFFLQNNAKSRRKLPHSFTKVTNFSLSLCSNHTRITVEEAIIPYSDCVANISLIGWCVILLSILFWIFRLIRFFYHAVQYYDIKKFFETALKIDDVSVYSKRIYLFCTLNCVVCIVISVIKDYVDDAIIADTVDFDPCEPRHKQTLMSHDSNNKVHAVAFVIILQHQLQGFFCGESRFHEWPLHLCCHHAFIICHPCVWIWRHFDANAIDST